MQTDLYEVFPIPTNYDSRVLETFKRFDGEIYNTSHYSNFTSYQKNPIHVQKKLKSYIINQLLPEVSDINDKRKILHCVAQGDYAYFPFIAAISDDSYATVKEAIKYKNNKNNNNMFIVPDVVDNEGVIDSVILYVIYKTALFYKEYKLVQTTGEEETQLLMRAHYQNAQFASRNIHFQRCVDRLVRICTVFQEKKGDETITSLNVLLEEQVRTEYDAFLLIMQTTNEYLQKFPFKEEPRQLGGYVVTLKEIAKWVEQEKFYLLSGHFFCFQPPLMQKIKEHPPLFDLLWLYKNPASKEIEDE